MTTRYAEFRKLSPKITSALIKMRQESFKNGAVRGKYKVLTALAIVVVTKCEPCVRSYVKSAIRAGVTEEELTEFLNVAITEGGCPAEQWAIKAYKFYKELKQSKQIEEELCCQDEEIE